MSTTSSRQKTTIGSSTNIIEQQKKLLLEKKQWSDAVTTFSRCLFEDFRCYDVDHGMSFLVLGIEYCTQS
jgi:hypothetical protein